MINLESDLKFDKEMIYAAALLHDIGKYRNEPHNETSAEYAVPILFECGFNDTEIKIIYKSILNHREKGNKTDDLDYLLYEGDKKSRVCTLCSATLKCNWPDDKKNNLIY